MCVCVFSTTVFVFRSAANRPRQQRLREVNISRGGLEDAQKPVHGQNLVRLSLNRHHCGVLEDTASVGLRLHTVCTLLLQLAAKSTGRDYSSQSVIFWSDCTQLNEN